MVSVRQLNDNELQHLIDSTFEEYLIATDNASDPRQLPAARQRARKDRRAAGQRLARQRAEQRLRTRREESE